MNDRTEEIGQALEISGPWPRLDPYIVWGLLTGFRDYGELSDGGLNVSIAFEIWEHGLSERQGAYPLARPLPIPPGSRFGTGVVTVDQLKRLLAKNVFCRIELGSAVQQEDGVIPVIGLSIVDGVAVVVIDDFIAFAHQEFTDSVGETRFVCIWSQDRLQPQAVEPGQWEPKEGLPYGYEWPPLKKSGAPLEAPPSMFVAYPRVLPRRSHGTAVSSLAVGNSASMSSTSTAALIGVHLPRATVRDTSGGSLNVQALDAILYALAKCAEKTRVVVNLSYATHAGPHDGTSILEAAIDQWIDLRCGNLAVVVPAGNAYSQRSHAQFTLCDGTNTQALHWFVPPALRRPSFLEVWLPDAGQGFDLELLAPDGSIHLKTTRAPQIMADGIDTASTRCSIIRLPQVANGLNGTMLLIALAPTAGIDGQGVLSPAGVWKLSFSLHEGIAEVGPVRAWIERGDSLPDFPNLGTQSYFVDEAYENEGKTPQDPDDSCSVVRRRGAFNTVACGKHTIVAGGYRGLHTPEVRKYAEGTGSGPLPATHRVGPDFNACTEESAELRSLRVAGNQPGDVVRGNGTSLAAPQLTRLIAELMRDGPQTPAQIRKALACLTVPNDPPVPLDSEREGLGRLCSVLDSGPTTFNKPYL